MQGGRIAEIAARVAAPKGVRVIEGKGLRVYPGMIDSGTELGLSEISAVRESVDTGELGEYMPQLHAVVAVNPESEHFGVVRVNGISSVIARHENSDTAHDAAIARFGLSRAIIGYRCSDW